MSEQSTVVRTHEQGQVEYRDVPGFPGYRVGSDGSVWSRLSRNGIGPFKAEWRRLSPGNCRGYHLYGLHRDGKRHNRLAHVLVLTAFVCPCPEGMEGCHNDGDPGNNRLDNLRWDTRRANHQDSFRHGTRLIGERHPLTDCTEERMAEALMLVARGFSVVEASLTTGVPLNSLSKAARGRSWHSVHSSGKRFRALKRAQLDTALRLAEQMAGSLDGVPPEAAEQMRAAADLLRRAWEGCRQWWGSV